MAQGAEHHLERGTIKLAEQISIENDIFDEKDIPGASLNGRDPSYLKIPELKRWLLCRNASMKGKKADLVLR